ncbi:MAG: DUF2950 family protein [Acetobacteraceae bacterium]|nr:DUF2950 family protein [Acetobacteraceae bacterium]
MTLRRLTLLLVVALGAPAGPLMAQPAPEPQTSPAPAPQLRAFATPEAAIQGLIQAMGTPDIQALTEVLGRRVLNNVPRVERDTQAQRLAAARQLAAMRFEIVYDNEARTRAGAVFGPDRIRLPAALVRGQRGWTFDPAGTITAMRERRIGVNEANALRALRALARAQDAYRRRDVLGDGVLQYAQHIASSPLKMDGLAPSPLGAVPGAAIGLNESFARAEGRPGEAGFNPMGGYGYRILTAQGTAAEGGAKSYLVNGRLTEGYAVIAWPVRPGETGLSTFIMDWRGNIFEREFGAGTAAEVARITSFDPVPGWTKVADTDR